MSLFEYETKFRDLNPNYSTGHSSPHKVCMLLAVIDLVEKQQILTNKIFFDEKLKSRFTHHFEKFRQGNDRNNPYQPFFHLRTQGFWHHVVRVERRAEYERMVQQNDARGPQIVSEIIEYAYLDDELYEYLRSSVARPMLVAALAENLDEDLREKLLRPSHGWTWEECEIIARSYLEMLELELKGEEFNKAERNRALREEISRSRESIERKHMNLSALLRDMGFPFIDGYKPNSHYQKSILPDVVGAQLAANPQIRKLVEDLNKEVPTERVKREDILDRLDEAPQISKHDEISEPKVKTYTPLKIDFISRNASNQALGLAGEKFVLQYERARLNAENKAGLAERIEHTSRLDDAAGFDIRSFESNGSDRFIEVKTTSYARRTPFYVTPNELETSRRNTKKYHLFRVYHFNRDPRFFVRSGNIDSNFVLTPNQFIARA